MAWANDVDERLAELKSFARMGRGGVDTDGFSAGMGKYLLLHFELMTVDDQDRSVDRQDVYGVVEGIVKKLRGAQLTGTVDLLPLPRDRSSERYAAQFWNALVKALEDLLRPGDSFFLHYSGRGLDRIGAIAQVVPAHQRTLSKVEVPEDPV